MDYDFLHKLPQQGRGEFLKAGVLTDYFHKLFSVLENLLCKAAAFSFILITILTLDKIIVKMVITPETLLTN